MLTTNYRGPVLLPPANAAPLGLGYWQALLTERTYHRGVGAAMWLQTRIAAHRGARFEDGQRNPSWAGSALEGPGTCWFAPRDVGAWLIADGFEVAHEADIAPATPAADQTPTPSDPVAPQRTRRDAMSVQIEQVQARCADPLDVAEVWARLLALADATSPPHPIIGREVNEVKGRDVVSIKWQSDASEGVKFLTRNALRQRINPRPPKRR